MEFTQQFVSKTPIPRALGSQHTAISDLARALSERANPALEQMLSGLVYELYFSADLHARGLKLLDTAEQAGLGALSGLNGKALSDAVDLFVKTHLVPGQPLRVMLSDLQTLDVVRIIEGKV